MCPQGRAHWCHQANTIELVLPSAHPSPQPKLQIDHFSRYCTAHGRKCPQFTMGDPFPPNCLFSWWDRDPIYFMIPWARLSPQSKLHHDLFSYFCTGDRRVSLYFTFGTTSLKIAPSHRGSGLDPHVRHDSLDPSEPTDQMASLSVQPFLYRWPQCPYTLQWDAIPPVKIALLHGGSGPPHLIHGSLGPSESSTQVASRLVQPF